MQYRFLSLVYDGGAEYDSGDIPAVLLLYALQAQPAGV